MGQAAFSAFVYPPSPPNAYFAKPNDLHWIRWGFSFDRWAIKYGFNLGENTFISYLCSIINAHMQQSRHLSGLDVTYDWMIDRIFKNAISRSTLQRILKALARAGLIHLPRKRPGNHGKRIVFLQPLYDIVAGKKPVKATPRPEPEKPDLAPEWSAKLEAVKETHMSDESIHRSKRPIARSDKDQSYLDLTSQPIGFKQPERACARPSTKKLERIDPVLWTVMFMCRKTGIALDERKRIFRRCQIELSSLDDPKTTAMTEIDWNYYRQKWPGMSFAEREGIAKTDLLPLVKRKKPKATVEEPPATPKERAEIREAILASLGVTL